MRGRARLGTIGKIGKIEMIEKTRNICLKSKYEHLKMHETGWQLQ